MSGSFLGLFLWENISLDTLGACGELSEALTEGLTALSRQNEVRTAVRQEGRRKGKV